MKTNIILCLLSISLAAFCQDYYWYENNQIPLQKGNQLYILYEEDHSRSNDSLQLLNGGNISKSKNLKWGVLNQSSELVIKNIVYQMPSYLCFDGTQNVFITHRFYVKLKRTEDFSLLQSFANQHNVEIEQDENLPLWYILSCGLNSRYNALELANIFYESGLFAVSEPEFMGAMRMNCVNDAMFNEQWNLNNTGQYGAIYSGLDINYCEAHAITQGSSSVIIGVYDLGVDLTHPDLNLHSFSYDTYTDSSPSQIYSSNGNNYHGTACAGIIGAKANNSIGVAGIAPNCPIMSLSINFPSLTYEQLKKGFITAADNGCQVISNSWGGGFNSSYLNAGISYALSHGRNGKGCVVVFAAGNDNSSVNYPANSNDSIIVVGAMSPCGERKNPSSCDGENWWGSNYGNELDVVAPGVKIRTTDNVGIVGKTQTDYMTNFNGTSSACPHVAAVAGLILSVNQNLTQKDVADIIELTAQKVGNYSYTQNTGRSNGTWNNEMGYGLVDAYAAVQMAKNYPIMGPDYICHSDTIKCYLAKASTFNSLVTWSLSNASNFLWNFSIIGNTHLDTVLVKATYSDPLMMSHNGQGYSSDMLSPREILPTLSVTITTGSTSKTYSKKFRMPIGQTPSFTASSSATWYTGTPRTFTVTNCTNEPDSVFSWIAKRGATIAGTGTGKSFTFTPVMIGTYNISVTNNEKECGNATTTHPYSVYRKTRIDATSDNNILNIILSEEDEDAQRSPAQLNENSDYTIELWHSIFGRMKEQTFHSSTIRIDTSSLPLGVYVVVLKENGEVIAQTKVRI